MKKRFCSGLALALLLTVVLSAFPVTGLAALGDDGTVTGTQATIAARGASATLTFTHTGPGGGAFKIFEMLYIYDPALATFDGFGASTNAAVQVADFPDISGLNATNNNIPAGYKAIMVGDDTSKTSLTTVLNFSNILPSSGTTFTVIAIPRQYGLGGNGAANGWGYAYNSTYDELPVIGNEINMTNANGVVTLQSSTEVSVAVTPKTSTVAPGGTKNFSATVANDGTAPDNGVTWALSGGPYAAGTAIDPATGVLTVDAAESLGTVITVVATSKKDGTKSDTGSTTVMASTSTNELAIQAEKEWRDASKSLVSGVSDVSTFKLEAIGSAPMPAGASGSPLAVTTTVTGAGTATFSNITYTAAGRYFYKLTEVVPSTPNPNVSYDDDEVIVLVDAVASSTTPGQFDITVIYYKGDAGDIHIDTSVSPNEVADYNDKSNLFTNVYDSKNLIVSKTVTGNGDQQKDFTFTVSFSNPGAYVWTKSPSSTTGTTVNGAPFTFTLKHGESIEFAGLSTATNWTVVETAETGYATSWKDKNGLLHSNSLTATGTIGGTTSKADYTNDFGYTPPTGITADDLPFVVLGTALLLGLAAFLILRSKRRYTRV